MAFVSGILPRAPPLLRRLYVVLGHFSLQDYLSGKIVMSPPLVCNSFSNIFLVFDDLDNFEEYYFSIL